MTATPALSILRTILALLAAPIVSASAQTLRVTLLGTGTPIPTAERFGPSTLVEAGGQQLLFDCGRGVPIRLAQLHVPIGQLTAVFLTHLHSDHLVGLPDLWLTGWLANPQFGHRVQPMRLYGPRGTKDMADALRTAFAADLRIREADEHLPPAGAMITATEFEEGLVYDSAGVRVTAFVVDHGDLIKPAFGFRVDYAGHSVVLSGDTRPTENLVRYAQHADLLIHEVAMGRAAGQANAAALARVLAHHSSPESAGREFARIRPGLAVYSHIGLSSYDASIPAPTVDDLVAATRTTYVGPLEVGEDLMQIDIGDRVVVHRWAERQPSR